MCVACCIPKATNTHSVYTTLFAFPQNNGCTNMPQIYVIRTSPFLLICREQFYKMPRNEPIMKQYVLCNMIVYVCISASLIRLVHHILLTQHYIVTYSLSVCLSVCLCYIFSHYIIKDTFFGNNVLSAKRGFSFSSQLLSRKFLIIRNIQ
jgi:hypothetical protein